MCVCVCVYVHEPRLCLCGMGVVVVQYVSEPACSIIVTYFIGLLFSLIYYVLLCTRMCVCVCGEEEGTVYVCPAYDIAVIFIATTIHIYQNKKKKKIYCQMIYDKLENEEKKRKKN